MSDPQRREEGGTPDIVGAVRAGLVFKLQPEVGAERIERIEQQHIRYALDSWQTHSDIDVLGNPEADRLAIASFRIKHGDKDLHYGFVVALLNDLFGIQARGLFLCGPLRTRVAEHGYGLQPPPGNCYQQGPDDITAGLGQA